MFPRFVACIGLIFGLVSLPVCAFDQPVDRIHGEVPQDAWRSIPLMPYYDVSVTYLDDLRLSVRERLFLADTLTPVDFSDRDVRLKIKQGEIKCTPFTCNHDQKVVGYNPQEYARLKALVASSSSDMAKTSGAIKTLGLWKNKYPIYDFEKDHTSIALSEANYSGSKVFLDPLEVVAALTPVELSDIQHGFTCVILCHTDDDGLIIGYDPVAAAKFKSRLYAMSAEERTAFMSNIQQSHERRLSLDSQVRQATQDAESKRRWQASYITPSIIDPSTSSAVPIRVIRDAITGKESVFNLTTWKETNTYVLSKNGESISYIEYQAQWDIRKENVQFVNSSGGINYRSSRMNTTGVVGLVKRGNAWYIISK